MYFDVLNQNLRIGTETRKTIFTSSAIGKSDYLTLLCILKIACKISEHTINTGIEIFSVEVMITKDYIRSI